MPCCQISVKLLSKYYIAACPWIKLASKYCHNLAGSVNCQQMWQKPICLHALQCRIWWVYGIRAKGCDVSRDPVHASLPKALWSWAHSFWMTPSMASCHLAGKFLVTLRLWLSRLRLMPSWMALWTEIGDCWWDAYATTTPYGRLATWHSDEIATLTLSYKSGSATFAECIAFEQMGSHVSDDPDHASSLNAMRSWAHGFGMTQYFSFDQYLSLHYLCHPTHHVADDVIPPIT
jgi:hypothetical protein